MDVWFINRCYLSAEVLADFPAGDSTLRIVNEYAGNSWLKLLPATLIVVVTGTTLAGFSRELLSLPCSDLRTVILASGAPSTPKFISSRKIPCIRELRRGPILEASIWMVSLPPKTELAQNSAVRSVSSL